MNSFSTLSCATDEVGNRAAESQTMPDPPDERLGGLDGALRARFAGYIGFHRVWMPPIWKERDPVPFHFFVFRDDLPPEQLHGFLALCADYRIVNARPISGPLLELASLFHPVFYANLTSYAQLTTGELARFVSEVRGCRLLTSLESSVEVASVTYFLQSLLFLAGCTLSAAIVQNRFCPDTLGSKLSRLWQGSQYARRYGLETFPADETEAFVIDCDARSADSPYRRLMEIKKAYGRALSALTPGIAYRRQVVKCQDMASADRHRFGFVDVVKERIGVHNLRCVIAYGSAVTSEQFADYDALVLTRDSTAALERLAGTNPTYCGRDINLGIYDDSDFMTYQLMSGDNLNHNARCIYGEGEIPVKPAADLMARNFSFAFIRLRQLLGMAGYLALAKVHPGLHLQSNLYEYFIKIPMHVMKGVLSVAGEPIAKDLINRWTARVLGYDLANQAALVRAHRMEDAIASAYHATRGVVSYLNDRFQVFEVVPRQMAGAGTYAGNRTADNDPLGPVHGGDL
jgi:hypothetical protein